MKTFKTYAQLIRLPNVFSAFADILLGAAVVSSLQPLDHAIYFLLAASACLYSAGMVLNDFFDVKQDTRERPGRPIPSGRVSRAAAGLFGFSLLLIGVAIAMGAHSSTEGRSTFVAAALASCILFYDGVLKRTWAGPLAMGSCRFLNVMLGLSPLAFEQWHVHLAGVVGTYIAGVTVFARTEAHTTSGITLVLGALVMFIAYAGAEALPAWFEARPSISEGFSLLITLWIVVVGIPVVLAIRQPGPWRIQRAIKVCIFGLIGLDAALATLFIGLTGLWILILLIPALILGRWIYST